MARSACCELDTTPRALHTYVAMSDSPWFSDLAGTAMRLSDVNGLADLVHVRFNEVDVWLNIDGKSWTDRRILGNVPISAGHTNRVRIADVNGSGTADILWGDVLKVSVRPAG